MFGSIDFQLDLGIQGDGDELLYFRSQLVFVSRLAGLAPPIDGVTVSTGDLDLVRVEAMRAGSLGFAGKLCIHPAQVGVVNRAFAPSTEEVSWARRVVALARESGGSAARLDGQMIDRPLIL